MHSTMHLALGAWSLGIGSWSLVLGPWSLVLGPWSSGPWPLVLGPWSLVHGPWPLVLGPWVHVFFYILILGHWPLVPGLWSRPLVFQLSILHKSGNKIKIPNANDTSQIQNSGRWLSSVLALCGVSAAAGCEMIKCTGTHASAASLVD